MYPTSSNSIPCVQVLGFGVSNVGFRDWISWSGFRVSGFGFRVSDSRLGFGFQVSCFGFRVSGFGLRVSVLGSRVSGLGLRVSGFGFRVRVSEFRFRVLDFRSGVGIDRFRARLDFENGLKKRGWQLLTQNDLAAYTKWKLTQNGCYGSLHKMTIKSLFIIF